MADISKITLPSGTTYEIKDEVARQAIAGGVSFIISTDASNTPVGIEWTPSGGSKITGTLTADNAQVGAFYLIPSEEAGVTNIYREYIVVGTTGSKTWEKLGDTQIIGINKTPVDVLKSVTAQYPGDTATVSGGTTDKVLGEATTFTNAASTVTITNTNSKTSASKLKTAGSAGTMATINITKFNGGSGSFTSGSFSGGSFTQGTDTFTANTPTTPAKIDITKFNGGSLSDGSFNGGSGSFTQGTDIHTTTTYSVSNETLSITAGSFTQGTDTHTHTAATHTQGTLTPASFQAGFYTAGTKGSAASFTQGTDSFTPATHGEDSHTHTAASLDTGFYTAGTAPTMPTFDTVDGLWTGYDSASAAAQTITVGTNDKVTAVTGVGTITVPGKVVTVTPTTESVIKDVSLTK